jgi:hypothetical protein
MRFRSAAMLVSFAAMLLPGLPAQAGNSWSGHSLKAAGHVLHRVQPGHAPGWRAAHRLHRAARHFHSGFARAQIAIVIGATGAPAATRVEATLCRPGEFCTIRLGHGPAAPKIISLNRTGRAIRCAGNDCAPVE